jgi:transposase-like protein
MTQAERDRLVALKKADKRLITQRQAAQELKVSERHVRRLVAGLRAVGDRAIVHKLRGKPSHRRLPAELEQRAMEILADPKLSDYGPTLGSQYVAKKHGISISKETMRQWMIRAGRHRVRRQRVTEVHQWRPRRERFGELVQWDTSEHDWLEGRGEKIYLVTMIDDATSRMFARFVRHDSTEENMNVLRQYLERFGRPLEFYTDKASLFQTAPKKNQLNPEEPLPPTQIGRALQELGIGWIAAHSPQAKGRVERSFQTAQDRLVKLMRAEGVQTLEQANAFLETEYLRDCEKLFSVLPASGDDAHRPLGKQHDLSAILCAVEQRVVTNDYTFRFGSRLYQIARKDIGADLRGSRVRVERRSNGDIAVRFNGKYLNVSICTPAAQATTAVAEPKGSIPRPGPNAGGKSKWMNGFWDQPARPIWSALKKSNATS